jgi:CBS domain-containing protein
MRPPVMVLQPDDGILVAIQAMLAKGTSGAPVIDENNHLVGILTEKDCLRVMSNSFYSGVNRAGKVSDFMSPVKRIVEPGMDLFAVVGAFLNTDFPALPVIEDDKLVGHITRRDALRGIQRWQRITTERISRNAREAHLVQQAPSSIEEMQRIMSSHGKDQIIAVYKKS